MKRIYSLILTLILAVSFSNSYAYVYDKIKVIVNNQTITQNQIEITLLTAARAGALDLSTPEKKAAALKKIEKQLIDNALLDAEADKLNIVVTGDELDDEVRRFQQKRQLNPVDFEDMLNKQGISLNDFKNNIMRQIKRRRLINRKVKSTIELTDKKLKAYYESTQKENYQVKARHILIRLDPKANAQLSKQALKKINKIRERILLGEDFAILAAELSEDPTAKSNKGVIGYFGKTDMVKQFSEMAFSLKPYELSKPVRTVFGYHLIEVLDRKKSKPKPFEKVKARLYQTRYQELFQKKYQGYIKRLRIEAEIEYR